ncbi:MAG: methyltransferase [Bacteroidetes bacterium]|nr:methyltransferase [Bacteroidota bacterium]
MTDNYIDEEFSFDRYPKTDNFSLKAWNAADEHILNYLEDNDLFRPNPVIYNDRFGFLTCVLNYLSPVIVISEKSQEKSCRLNMQRNNLKENDERFVTPLASLPGKVDLGIVKLPKSLDLFRLYLDHLSAYLHDDSLVICSFMTRHFTQQILEIANEFFYEFEQSKAWKKSRVLILSKPKKPEPIQITNSIEWREKTFKQYFGVFSAGNIDYATQFLIDNITVKNEDKTVLDLASGNGIIACAVKSKNPDCEINLIDDSFLAVESSKLNLSGEKIFFYFNDTLEDFESDYFDLVISNPPFHFEYENNIEVALSLFNDVVRCLKIDGRFLLVASRHLNYRTHLENIFSKVLTVAENDKFIIYECTKHIIPVV